MVIESLETPKNPEVEDNEFQPLHLAKIIVLSLNSGDFPNKFK